MNLLIIQARMGSSRLAGKVMKKINGAPLLQLLHNRILHSSATDEIVIAITKNKEDDVIQEFCNSYNINFFRGSDWDVLDRFYQTATSQKIKPKNIIRICADNPLLSYDVIDEVFNNYIKSGKDYFSNSNQERMMMMVGDCVPGDFVSFDVNSNFIVAEPNDHTENLVVGRMLALYKEPRGLLERVKTGFSGSEFGADAKMPGSATKGFSDLITLSDEKISDEIVIVNVKIQ